MESTAAVQPPPQAIVMQMAMGAWVTKVISEATRMGVPDVVREHGPMRAAEMVSTGGVIASPDALERLLRACASVGIFTEDAAGRFGPTPLSEVLTADSPVSVKALAQETGGLWLKMWIPLADAIRTGEPQARQIFGMEWWDYLKA